MARTISEIYEAIIAEKNTKASLTNLAPSVEDTDNLKTDLLNNPSAVGVWRLWAYITAASIWTLENLQDLFKTEVSNSAAAAIFGTSGWWIDKLKAFQLGDALTIVNIGGIDRLTYEVIDESKQIITRAAIVDQDDGSALIKVAKDADPGPGLEPLNTAEITQVKNYINDQQPAGAKIFLSSLFSDKLKIEADIFYNGLLDIATVTADVETSINNYLSNLDFNGSVNRNKLIDAIQATNGVEDIDINILEGRADATAFISIDREYLTSAGYIEIDPAFLLEDTLNFIAS